MTAALVFWLSVLAWCLAVLLVTLGPTLAVRLAWWLVDTWEDRRRC